MNARCQNNDIQLFSRVRGSRRGCRESVGHLNWVYGHLQITKSYCVDRVPLPEKGERVERRGRKATGQGWALIAGLPKDGSFKRQRKGQDFRAH